ncbi:MAG: hypothetical protein IKZ88_03410 [Neisseriaceae bacterium]|nr:hypothetical protein [Neisseriaceae bacterium]
MGSLVVGTIYYGLMFILAGFFLLLALIFPKKAKGFFIAAGCIVVLFVIVIPLWARLSLKIMEIEERPIKEAAEKRYNEARAVFDEQCKKAGEKIYRTVDNVDGVMLLKVRGETDRSYWDLVTDPMWDDAAIADIESLNGAYISSFLNKSKIKDSRSVRKGYKFVDVLKEDNSISRYLEYKGYGSVDEERDGVIKNPSDPARYAVTYENNVNPELRKHWVAGVTIKIIDRQTDELLAEKTIFSFESGLGSKATGRSHWTHLPVHCPELVQRTEDHNPTSRFVVTVLKP